VDEENETFLVELSAPTGAALDDATATGTITDDDLPTVSLLALPTVSFGKASYTVNEDDGILILDIVLSEAQTAQVEVELQLNSGTAAAVTDDDDDSATADATWGGYTIAFEPRETRQTASLSIVDNNQVEPDETFTVSLLLTQGQANLGSPTTVTITDDDIAWLSFETPGGARTTEGNVTEGSEVTLVIRLSKPHKQDVAVKIAVSGVALPGKDYAGIPRLVTIPAGQQTQRITISALADQVEEQREDVILTLSSAAKGVRANESSRYVLWISDPDPNQPATAVTLSSNVASVAEDVASAPTVTVTATLGGSATFTEAKTVTVSVGRTGDTAVSGTDYAAVADFDITIAAGESSGTASFTLDPNDDALDEPDETLTLHGTGSGLKASSTEITITDDDPPVVSVADASATEGDKVTFTVRLSSASNQAVTVKWVTASDSSQGANPATAGDDYTAVTTAQTLTIPAGVTTATIEVQTLQDMAVESDETFLVILSAPSNASLAADPAATGTITDDELLADPPTLGFGKTSYVANEDDGILVLDIVLSEAQTNRVKIKLQLQSGTADTVNDDDGDRAAADARTWGGSTAVFEPGETRQTASIALVDNNQVEPDETFIVSLVLVEGQAKPNQTVPVTITDDDIAWLRFETPGGAITSGETVTEGQSIVFVIRMSRPHKQDVNLLLTPSGQAASGQDWSGLDLAFAIPAGEQKWELQLDALADEIAEGGEDLVLTLATDGAHAGVRISDPPRITIRIADPPQ